VYWTATVKDPKTGDFLFHMWLWPNTSQL
jgi:hypothetical protein